MIGCFKRGKNRNRKGFTLVELLVTITIFVIITGVVLFSQSRFDSTIFLTNSAYDTALALRQAQTYGVNIKNFVTVEGNKTINNFTPYGVHFDINNPTSFILFSDLDATIENGKVVSDGVFDGEGNGLEVSVSTCVTEDGCVNRYNLQRGNRIIDLCVSADLANWSCYLNNDEVSRVDVSFVRPNPNAIITWRQDDGKDLIQKGLRVKLSSDANSENTRTVVVQENGLIYVESR